MRSNSRLPALDGLRAYSALVVISGHIFSFGNPAHGVASVWVFFVLSGFLLFQPIVQRDLRLGGREIAGYLVKRLLRILPLYYLALTFYYVLESPPFLDDPSWLAQHVTFARASGHFWTVKQEMIFYLGLPLIAVTCAVLRSRFAAVALLVMLIPASYVVFDVWGLVVLHGGLGGMLLYPTPFLCGMALALVAGGLRTGWGVPLQVVGAGGLVLLNWDPAATFVGFERLLGLPKDGSPFSHPYIMWPFASALVLGAYLRPSAIFANRVISGIGAMAFGVYLWHVLIVSLVRRYTELTTPWSVYLATVAGSIALAMATYRWIEVPGMRCGHWLASWIAGRDRTRLPRQVAVPLAPATSAFAPSPSGRLALEQRAARVADVGDRAGDAAAVARTQLDGGVAIALELRRDADR